MSVRLDGDVIVLEGACRVEDAEPLLSFLQADPGRVVDLTRTEYLHTAVVQILVALKPTVNGTGHDPFVRTWMSQALNAADSVDTSPGDD